MWCLQILAVSSSWTRLNSWFHHHQLTCWMLVNYFSLPNFHFQEYMRMILTLGSFSGREDGRSAPRQCPIRATDIDPPIPFTPWPRLKGSRGETVGTVRTRPLKRVVKKFASFGLSRFIRHSSCRATNGHCPSTTPSTRDMTSRRVISPPLGILRFALVPILWWRRNGIVLWVELVLEPFLTFLIVGKAYHNAATHNIMDGTGGLDSSIFFELDRAEVSNTISSFC